MVTSVQNPNLQVDQLQLKKRNSKMLTVCTLSFVLAYDNATSKRTYISGQEEERERGQLSLVDSSR